MMSNTIIPSSKRKVPTKFQHLVLYTADLKASSDWYQKIFKLQFSAKNHPDSSAAMRLIKQTMHFFSFGHYHHDFAVVTRPDVTPDNTSLLYFSMRLKELETLAKLKTRLELENILYYEGRILKSANTPFDNRVIHFQDPINKYWIEVFEGKPTSKINFTTPSGVPSAQVNEKLLEQPKHAMPEKFASIAPVFKKRWLRELILLPTTLNGNRKYNKTEDYGVFRDSKCIISNLVQLTYFVSNLEKSIAWFQAMGFMHTRTCEPEAHPFQDKNTLKSAYLSLKEHEECVVLIEQRDTTGNIITPTIQDVFHSAFEIEGNRLVDVFDYWKQNKKLGIQHHYGPVKHNNSKPHGDGESGGNVAVYYYTPDFHDIEFCGDMDNVDNYEGRYGTGIRTLENDIYLIDNDSTKNNGL